MDLIQKSIIIPSQGPAHASEIVEQLARMVLQFPTISIFQSTGDAKTN